MPASNPLRLDFDSGEMRLGQARVRLRRKSLAVLRYLAERPGRLVTKNELLEAVWPDTYVSEGVLKVCVAELRKALREAMGEGEDGLVTLHGQGYRLDLPISIDAPPAAVPDPFPPLPPGPPAGFGDVVGRAAELQQLQRLQQRALSGERQVVFVTGEAGIGKTTLVEAFLCGLRRQAEAVVVGRGQCVQRYGTGEALMPLLEALGQICHGPRGASLCDALRRRAPRWMAELLDIGADGDPAGRQAPGATLESMLRVLVEALEAASVETPLVLLIEDLHWADPSTADFIATFAERRAPARLLLLGTYREAEVLAAEHPLKALKPHLQMRRRCEELRLAAWGETAIADYLDAHLGRGCAPAGLASFLGRWTEGNPFFLSSLLDWLTAQGTLARTRDGWRLTAELQALGPRVPETVQELIERQLARLEPEVQRLLETAAVAGFTLATPVIADAGQREGAEARCHELARRGQFLRLEGPLEWPDGTLATRYSFIHSLYQVALYERLDVARRRELHQRVGERLEAGYGARADEVAAELAVHFERSRDSARAVRYLAAAAAGARRRAAVREALGYMQREIALVPRLADCDERAEREFDVLVTVAGLRMLTEGTTREVGGLYARALELCASRPRPGRRFGVLAGLQAFYLNTAQLEQARATGKEMLALAEAGEPGTTRAAAWAALGLAEYPLGELRTARAHLELAAHEGATQQFLGFVDVRVLALGALAQVHAHLGDAARAFACGRDARRAAEELGTPFNVFSALYHETGVYQILGDWRGTLRRVEAQMALLDEHGFHFFIDKIQSMHGWALVRAGRVAEGVALLEQGLRACAEKEQGLARPHFLALLAEACAAQGDAETALGLADEALALLLATGERRFDPEVHCVRAEVLLAVAERTDTDRGAEAKACYGRAIADARRQSARTFELRAALGLARLWHREGRAAEARRLLAPLLSTFDDGVVTPDMQAARAFV